MLVMNLARNTGRKSNFTCSVFCLFYPFATDVDKLKLKARPQNLQEDNQVYVRRLDELFLVRTRSSKGVKRKFRSRHFLLLTTPPNSPFSKITEAVSSWMRSGCP